MRAMCPPCAEAVEVVVTGQVAWGWGAHENERLRGRASRSAYICYWWMDGPGGCDERVTSDPRFGGVLFLYDGPIHEAIGPAAPASSDDGGGSEGPGQVGVGRSRTGPCSPTAKSYFFRATNTGGGRQA